MLLNNMTKYTRLFISCYAKIKKCNKARKILNCLSRKINVFNKVSFDLLHKNFDSYFLEKLIHKKQISN